MVSVTDHWGRRLWENVVRIKEERLFTMQSWFQFSHLAAEMAYNSLLQELPRGPSHPVWLLPPPIPHGLPRATAHCHAPGQMDVSESHRTCGGKRSISVAPSLLPGHSWGMDWFGRKQGRVSFVPEFTIISQILDSADRPTQFWLFWHASAVHFAFSHNALF